MVTKDINPEGIYTVKDICKLTGRKSQAVRKWFALGKLVGFKEGLSGELRATGQEIIDLLDVKKPVEPAPPKPKPIQVQVIEEKPKRRTTKQTTEIPNFISLNPEVVSARDAVEIAKSNVELAEINLKKEALSLGFNEYKEVVAATEEKKKEILSLQKQIEALRRQIEKEQEQWDREVAEHQRKLQTDMAIFAEEKKEVNRKLKEAVELSNDIAVREARMAKMVNQVSNIVEYHCQNITPCVRSIQSVRRTIYRWIDLLTEYTNYDWSELYNYLGKITTVLDRYAENVPENMKNNGKTGG